MKRLGIEYFHEAFCRGNRIEKLFREVKEWAERLHSNVNSKTVENMEETSTAITLIQNRSRGGIIPTIQYQTNQTIKTNNRRTPFKLAPPSTLSDHL